MPRFKFEIEFQKHEPYRLKWLSNHAIKGYRVTLDEFNYYDEDNDLDIPLIP